MCPDQLSIKNWPLLDRPRERFLRLSPEQITDSELLAILIGTGDFGTRQTALDIARRLLERFFDLNGLSEANVSQVTEIKGIGETKAVRILAAIEIGRRLQKNQKNQKIKFENGRQIFEIYRHHMGALEHEVFLMLALNAKNQVIAEEKIAQGNISNVVINPRDVFQIAIRLKAVSVLFLHNHPSGSLTPSRDDISITSRLQRAGELLGVRVLDHLIITSEGYRSLHFDLKTPLIDEHK